MDIDKKVWEILCSEEEINQRIIELGKQISEDYKDKNLYIMSLLKGSFVFTADLVRKISIPVKIGFMTTSSYGHSDTSTGKVQMKADVTDSLEQFDVIVVDDIVDSGITMNFVLNHLKSKNPKSISSCVLLDKPSRRQEVMEPDYVGFTIEDKFVVGYGLNYGDYYRNVPYVFAVTNEDK